MDQIIERIASRQELLSRLSKNFSECARRFKGLEEAAESVLNNENEANTRKMLNTSMRIIRDQMEINQDLLALMVMFVSSEDFITQSAKLSIKLGSNPMGVLSELFNMKRKGKF